MDGSSEPNSRRRDNEYEEKNITSQKESFNFNHMPFQVQIICKKMWQQNDLIVVLLICGRPFIY